MSLADFDALNRRLTDAGEKPYANPRNLTAGAIKMKDPMGTAKYSLSFAAFDLLGADLPSEPCGASPVRPLPSAMIETTPKKTPRKSE